MEATWSFFQQEPFYYMFTCHGLIVHLSQGNLQLMPGFMNIRLLANIWIVEEIPVQRPLVVEIAKDERQNKSL